MGSFRTEQLRLSERPLFPKVFTRERAERHLVSNARFRSEATGLSKRTRPKWGHDVRKHSLLGFSEEARRSGKRWVGLWASLSEVLRLTTPEMLT